jgi:hypothetical protein
MALTAFQRTICRLLADRRIASGESYVAGAVALNEVCALLPGRDGGVSRLSSQVSARPRRSRCSRLR